MSARAAALPRWLFIAAFGLLIGGVIAAVIARGAEAAYDSGAEIVSVDNARDEQADDPSSPRA